MSKVKTINESNFDSTVAENEMVLVDFWAEWCGPCKAMGPVLDELSQKDEMKSVTVAKVNVDDAQALAAKYGIRGIPTFIMFKNGQVHKVKSGTQSMNDLIAMTK